MRYTPMAILLFLLLVQPGIRPSEHCRCDAVQADGHECLNDNHVLHEDGAMVVDDQALRKRLAVEGERLIEQKQITEMDELIKQLGRDCCELELPQPKKIAGGPVEVFAKAKDSVVLVAGLRKCEKCVDWHAAAASGFAIASGAIVTNYHVVDDSKKEALVVMTSDGRVLPVECVLAASQENDLAILKLDVDDLAPLAIASDTPPVGSPVSVISHPAGRYYCFTSGIVSRHMKMRSKAGETEGLSITADFARGSSGAPILDSQGRVIGIAKCTESVYYTEKGNEQKNLQMVFKMGIPAKNVLKLIKG